MVPGIKQINAVLKKDDSENEILEFDLESRPSIKIYSDDQADLREVFSQILAELLRSKNSKIEIQFLVDDAYPKDTSKLIIEVCEEYINQLNIEIEKISAEIPVLDELKAANEEEKTSKAVEPGKT